MVPTLEAIKGGGGSVRVGTVGTIGSLMTRELELSTNRTSRVPSSSRPTPVSGSRCYGHLKPRTFIETASSKHRSPKAVWRTSGHTQHLGLVSNAATPKRLKPKPPLEDVGNSTVSRGSSQTDFPGKGKSRKSSYRIPMLGAESISLETTPVREKPMKKKSSMVDMVDIKCGNPGGSLSNRLKKLGFSKLSQSFI